MAAQAAWSWGPYCWTSKGSDYSWDVYPSWIHTAHWGEFGVSYPWGCGGIRGGKAVLRFAANGYWDRYNHDGFQVTPRDRAHRVWTPLVVIVLAFVVVTLLAVFAGTSTHSGYTPAH